MKLNITGSELENHLRPLRAIVRQSDEKNYDSIGLSITVEDDGRKCLRAAIAQPTYDAFICLNLSGAGADADCNAGNEPIDADAVACSRDELWVFARSALSAVNRSVGQLRADYVATGSALDVSLGEDASLHLDGMYRRKALEYPDHDAIVESDEALLYGTFMAGTLPEALHTALAVSRLGGRSSNPMEQAVHLTLGADQLVVEALSMTAQHEYRSETALAIDERCRVDQPVHVCISRDGAQVLSDMAAISGGTVHWVYSRAQQMLMAWCQPYVLRLDAQEVPDCVCTPVEPGARGIRIDTRAMRRAIQRARNVGARVAEVVCHVSGMAELVTPGRSVVMTLPSRCVGEGLTGQRTFRLPVNVVHAMMSGILADEVVISFDDDSEYVVLETDLGVTNTISEV